MQQKIFFNNSKGDRLCGILSDTNITIDKNTFIMILIHGHHTSKDNLTNQKLEKLLSKKGIAIFRFDIYGHGESDGKIDDLTISEGIDDLNNAIRLVNKKGYKNIGLLGSSLGGNVALIGASKFNNLKLLVLKSPVSDFRERIINKFSKKELQEWKKKSFREYQSAHLGPIRQKYVFYTDAKKLNGYAAAKKIKIPTLIVHGDKDEQVPLEYSKKTSKIIKNCRLEIIKGANHSYTDPKHFNKMIKLVSEFIIEHAG